MGNETQEMLLFRMSCGARRRKYHGPDDLQAGAFCGVEASEPELQQNRVGVASDRMCLRKSGVQQVGLFLGGGRDQEEEEEGVNQGQLLLTTDS